MFRITTCRELRRLRSSLVLGVLVLAAVVSTRWVRLNVSQSVPYGLYRMTSVPAPLQRGMLVLMPTPASVRPWHSSWMPLLKPIAGLPGDRVCHRDHTLFINDMDFGLVLRESQRKPVPHLPEGCTVVSQGSVFLASAVPRSLDSRYFGMVPVATLTAQAIPCLTWR